MTIPLPHNKWVLIGLVGGAIVLGLYLRSRNASTDATNTTDSQDPLSDINDPYSSGSYDTTAAGGGIGTGDSQYPYGASPPPVVIRLIPPKKAPIKKKPVRHKPTAGKHPVHKKHPASPAKNRSIMGKHKINQQPR